MIETSLKHLNFTPNLTKVYLALFELGKCRAGQVIEKTALPRSVVYASLEELVERELVSQTESRGVAMFSPNDPAHLVEEADEKKRLAKDIADEIKKNRGAPPREVVVSEGLDAIMRATDRSLLAERGETMYVLGASALNVQTELDKHWRLYHKKRAKRGVHFKALYDHTVDKSFLDFRNSLPLSEARYLPEGLEMPVWFNICGDVCSIMVPGEDPPLVFTVRSRPTAEALKKYFEYFWNMAERP